MPEEEPVRNSLHFHRGGYLGFRPRNPRKLRNQECRKDGTKKKKKKEDSAVCSEKEEALDREWTARQNAQSDVQARNACSTNSIEVPGFLTCDAQEGEDSSRIRVRQTLSAEPRAWAVDESLLEIHGETFGDPLEILGVHRFVDPGRSGGVTRRVSKGNRAVAKVFADFRPAQLTISAVHVTNNREGHQLTFDQEILRGVISITQSKIIPISEGLVGKQIREAKRDVRWIVEAADRMIARDTIARRNLSDPRRKCWPVRHGAE
ncbi:hypothetical protein K438DRAFT_1936775 [Mycena galopus ATCC 62051]|nr:hypothetical protein K438DRAFT_1936775 [Mycena galopus ATCC 62051]